MRYYVPRSYLAGDRGDGEAIALPEPLWAP